jgi:hypothetical protein
MIIKVPERELAVSRWLAHHMDSRWGVGPYRFGLEILLRLIPFVGGTSSTLVSLYQFLLAIRLRLPPGKLARMAAYVGVDAILGLIPYLGDFADGLFRVHVRNQRIIDGYLEAAAGR